MQRIVEIVTEFNTDVQQLASVFTWLKDNQVNLRKVDMIENTQDRSKCHLSLQLDCRENADMILQEIEERFKACRLP